MDCSTHRLLLLLLLYTVIIPFLCTNTPCLCCRISPSRGTVFVTLMLYCWLCTDTRWNVRALVYPKGATYKVSNYRFIWYTHHWISLPDYRLKPHKLPRILFCQLLHHFYKWSYQYEEKLYIIMTVYVWMQRLFSSSHYQIRFLFRW